MGIRLFAILVGIVLLSSCGDSQLAPLTAEQKGQLKEVMDSASSMQWTLAQVAEPVAPSRAAEADKNSILRSRLRDQLQHGECQIKRSTWDGNSPPYSQTSELSGSQCGANFKSRMDLKFDPKYLNTAEAQMESEYRLIDPELIRLFDVSYSKILGSVAGNLAPDPNTSAMSTDITLKTEIQSQKFGLIQASSGGSYELKGRMGEKEEFMVESGKIEIHHLIHFPGFVAALSTLKVLKGDATPPEENYYLNGESISAKEFEEFSSGLGFYVSVSGLALQNL
jgi:hypothetical protein